MPTPIKCPGCQAGFEVPDSLAGKTIRCTSCKTQLTVPVAARPSDQAGSKAETTQLPTPTEKVEKPAATKPAAKAARAVREDESRGKSNPAKPSGDRRPAKAAKAVRRRDEDDDDEDDEEDDRPARRGKKKKDQGGSSGMILIVGGGVVGLIAVVGVAIAMMSGGKKETAQNDSGSTPAVTTPSANPKGGPGAMPPGGPATPGTKAGDPTMPGTKAGDPFTKGPGIPPPGGDASPMRPGGPAIPPKADPAFPMPPGGTAVPPKADPVPPRPPGGLAIPPKTDPAFPMPPGGTPPPKGNPTFPMPPGGTGIPPKADPAFPMPPGGAAVPPKADPFPNPNGMPPGPTGGPTGNGQPSPDTPPPGAETHPPLAAKVSPFYAIVFDPEKGDAYTIAPRVAAGTKTGGTLTRYSYPDFKRKREFKLSAFASRAVIDPKKGVLYFASVSPVSFQAAFQHAFDRARVSGDIHAVDLEPIRADKIEDRADVKTTVMTVGSMIAGLEIAPDGKSLYVLTNRSVGGRQTSAIHQYDPAERKKFKSKDLPEPAWDMRASPDGKQLYVVEYHPHGGNKPAAVTVFDTEAWAVRSIGLPGAATDFAPGPGGRGVATVADTHHPHPANQPNQQFPNQQFPNQPNQPPPGGNQPQHGNPPQHGKLFLHDGDGGAGKEVVPGGWKAAHNNYAAFTPDGKHLLVTSFGHATASGIEHAGLDVYEVSDAATPAGFKKVASVKKSGGDVSVAVGGFFHISPDGRFVAFHTGAVLEVAKLADNVGGADLTTPPASGENGPAGTPPPGKGQPGAPGFGPRPGTPGVPPKGPPGAGPVPGQPGAVPPPGQPAGGVGVPGKAP